MWKRHSDLSKPGEMKNCLSLHFDSQEVDQIMQAANSAPVKEKLLASTDRALAVGAYGCPWFEVTNQEGVKEPFFGSDRFHYMWDFLGIPWIDIQIIAKSKM
jgi:glutathione S-transferase kappa 1